MIWSRFLKFRNALKLEILRISKFFEQLFELIFKFSNVQREECKKMEEIFSSKRLLCKIKFWQKNLCTFSKQTLRRVSIRRVGNS